MKKILIFIGLIFLLSSCFGESEDVKKAKQELGIQKATPSFDLTGEQKDNKEKEENTNSNLSNDPRISIRQISGPKVLELDKLNYTDFKNGHAKITGKTLGFVSKIEVDFSNPDSEYPNDEYILSKFKSGGKRFEYNANSKYKVLDFGLNKYLITAFTPNGESKIEIKVLVSVNDDKYLEGQNENKDLGKQEETKTTELIGDENDLVFTDLPEGGDFGNIIKLGEKSFTYSDIKALEIKKDKFEKISCEKDEENDTYFVTEFLKNRQNSWYYWNTCRDIVKDKGISFYVLRLDGDKYFYEKHYLDFKHGFYGIYELDSGEGITKDNISEKNKEFKEKNKDYKQTEIVDNLFKKIINN